MAKPVIKPLTKCEEALVELAYIKDCRDQNYCFRCGYDWDVAYGRHSDCYDWLLIDSLDESTIMANLFPESVVVQWLTH